MISILIPTYNFVVVNLVNSLVKQGSALSIKFEIIVSDDGSTSVISNQNQVINSIENCSYIKHTKNLGLSENRNILAKRAKFDNLLYIDGDSVIISSSYLQSYIAQIPNTYDVVYGGRVHPRSAHPDRMLRWNYGIRIEDKSARTRKAEPYSSILFNNTLIRKDLVETIKFESSINTYGHEDTLFAFQLSKIQATVLHLNNPVEHGDIDENEVYLAKTKNALQNLYKLYQAQSIDNNFIKFLRVFSRLKRLHLTPIISAGFTILEKPLYRNLKSRKASLLLFNMYRLGYFCHLK